MNWNKWMFAAVGIVALGLFFLVETSNSQQASAQDSQKYKVQYNVVHFNNLKHRSDGPRVFRRNGQSSIMASRLKKMDREGWNLIEIDSKNNLYIFRRSIKVD